VLNGHRALDAELNQELKQLPAHVIRHLLVSTYTNEMQRA
jgi:hypothetical protein